MSLLPPFLARLLGLAPDDREAVRPLWHAITREARGHAWYADAGIADTVPGRFDTITLVLATVLLRMERKPALIAPSVRLTELFVEDMDGQLREAGVGDLVVGKQIGKLISGLGGRLGALRDGLSGDDATLEAAVRRNVSLRDGAAPAGVARMLRELSGRLAVLDDKTLLAGKIAA